MKKTFTVLSIALIITAIFAGCGSSPKADYDSPKAVIEALNAIHTEWENNQLYNDLEGKTFIVKTSKTLDKSDPVGDQEAAKKSPGRNWVCIPYSDINIDVMLWLTNEQWESIKYKKGDTLVLQVEFIAQRGTKNGSLRQYYINAILPE